MRAINSGSSAARFISKPMRRIGSGCCARAARSGSRIWDPKYSWVPPEVLP